MEPWLNYNHLHYFWVVAREGGLVQAAKVLHVSHPTLSAQIRALEERLGHALFDRMGRRLVLTDMGHLVYRHAEEIFSRGRDMLEEVAGRSIGMPRKLEVGIIDVFPKLVVRRLLEPVLTLAEPVRLVCHEDNYDRLLARLALHELDVVLADAPIPTGSAVRAFNHLLGQCGVGIYGTPALARRYKPDFPASLTDAPMLLPLERVTLRRSMDHWLSSLELRPTVVAEFEDSALLKVFGSEGYGLFPAPLVVEDDIVSQYGVTRVGLAEGVSERFYAVSAERKLRNPGVVAVTDTARRGMFGTPKA